jgi:hypothetical protein
MTATFDAEARLLIGFFQRAFQAGEVEPDPVRYLNKFRSEIKITGRFLEYLGLAKADKKSALGWKPTAPLLDLIANSKARRSKPTKKSASLADTLIIDLMLETVLGNNAGNFCCSALIELGLIVQNLENDWLPAPELLRLFDQAYTCRRAPDQDAVYAVLHTLAK